MAAVTDTSLADTVCMAVVSDLHAFAGSPAFPPSTLREGASEEDAGDHPIVGLEALIEGSDPPLRADVLLCPGDLGDRASRAGVGLGWRMVHRVASALGAQVVATVGNHDVHSRPGGDEIAPTDPVDVLKGLRPRFPVDDRPIQQAFFAEHYAVVDGPAWRVVTMNSSASHGYGDTEYEFGRISARARRSLCEDLTSAARSPLNVLLLA